MVALLCTRRVLVTNKIELRQLLSTALHPPGAPNLTWQVAKTLALRRGASIAESDRRKQDVSLSGALRLPHARSATVPRTPMSVVWHPDVTTPAAAKAGKMGMRSDKRSNDELVQLAMLTGVGRHLSDWG